MTKQELQTHWGCDFCWWFNLPVLVRIAFALIVIFLPEHIGFPSAYFSNSKVVLFKWDVCQLGVVMTMEDKKLRGLDGVVVMSRRAWSPIEEIHSEWLHLYLWYDRCPQDWNRHKAIHGISGKVMSILPNMIALKPVNLLWRSSMHGLGLFWVSVPRATTKILSHRQATSYYTSCADVMPTRRGALIGGNGTDMVLKGFSFQEPILSMAEWLP